MKQTVISSIEKHEEFKQVNDRIDEFNAIVIIKNEDVKSKHDKNLKKSMIFQRLFAFKELTRDDGEDIN